MEESRENTQTVEESHVEINESGGAMIYEMKWIVWRNHMKINEPCVLYIFFQIF